MNLLQCRSLDSFKQKIIEVLHPTAFLPNICMCPEPTFNSTLKVLELALQVLPKVTLLILFIEDVNKVTEWKDWKGPLATLITNVGSNGIVVGNSAEVLSYTKFESLSHTGIRTSDLKQYAKAGGHFLPVWVPHRAKLD